VGVRRVVRLASAVALVVVLGLAVPAPGPAGANAGDVYLAPLTPSKQYDVGGCKYKVFWGNLGPTVAASIKVYNLSACGGAVLAVQYWDGTAVQMVSTTAVDFTATDGCGTYQHIEVSGGPGTALRTLVWLGTGHRWYAVDGTVTQPGVTC